MFRTAVISIVLSLGAGPSTALLCKAWCDPHEAAVAGCHHAGAAGSPSLRGGDRCDEAVIGVAALLRDDGRRGVPAPDAGPVALIDCPQSIPFAGWGPPGHDPWQHRPPDTRPLVTPLRI